MSCTEIDTVYCRNHKDLAITVLGQNTVLYCVAVWVIWSHWRIWIRSSDLAETWAVSFINPTAWPDIGIKTSTAYINLCDSSGEIGQHFISGVFGTIQNFKSVTFGGSCDVWIVVSAHLSCIILRICLWSVALCPKEALCGGGGSFASVQLLMLLKYTTYISKFCHGSIPTIEKQDKQRPWEGKYTYYVYLVQQPLAQW